MRFARSVMLGARFARLSLRRGSWSGLGGENRALGLIEPRDARDSRVG